ncbi:MAG: hypothetical protein MI757_02420, partial [Pirellulales bacterium]|nr:hypothetical protein [Pirellulales bacterium]
MTVGRIWLACHAVGNSGDQAVDLRRVASLRLASLTNNHAKITGTENLQVAGRRGVMLEFEGMLPGEGTSIRGRHLAIDLGSSVCEIHLVAPNDEIDAVQTAARALIKSLVLGEPEVDTRPTTPHANDARPVFGAWKALRSRLYLDGQGNIAIEMDRPTVLS